MATKEEGCEPAAQGKNLKDVDETLGLHFSPIPMRWVTNIVGYALVA